VFIFRVDVKFIIGDSACGLPLGDRIDPFSCLPWFASTAGESTCYYNDKVKQNIICLT